MSWEKVDLAEVIGSALISIGVGMIRFLMLIRAGRRRVKWVDAVLEPAVAVFAGLCAWALTELANAPDLLQSVTVSLGAWSGPRFIHQLERKYLGGTRRTDEDNGGA